MKSLVLVAALLVGCVDDQTESTTQGVGEFVTESCGPEPMLPALSPTFESHGGVTRAVLSEQDYNALQHYVGINALWTSCVREL